MVETKKVKGWVMEITEKSGEKDGKQWKLFNYQIKVQDVGTRYFSTFRDIKDVPIDYECEIEYREKPNPTKPEYPRLEIVNIVWDKANTPADAMTEADFKKGYIERADLSNLQLNHFIGTYCRKYAPDIAKKATDLWTSK